MMKANGFRAALLSTVVFTAACSGEFGESPTAPSALTTAPASTPTAGDMGPALLEVYVSDLPWVSTINGWGPVERDRSNGEQPARDGRTITLNGRTYAKGIGAHAHSEIVFHTNGSCSLFAAAVGVDDEVDGGAGEASIVFEVWGDGVRLFKSGRMTGSSLTEGVKADISGRREIKLMILGAGDGIDFDHGDWADARLICDRLTLQ